MLANAVRYVIRLQRTELSDLKPGATLGATRPVQMRKPKSAELCTTR